MMQPPRLNNSEQTIRSFNERDMDISSQGLQAGERKTPVCVGGIH